MDYIKKYNIKYLYHITNICNLQSILKHGLLSHHQAHTQKLIINDLSNQSVQIRRSSKIIYNTPLHEYVCLYFNPKNPMLYVLKEKQNEILLIGVNPQLLSDPNTIFSDGNAASDNTKFYRKASYLEKLRWDIINSNSWHNIQDGKRIKCAEILVLSKIESKDITRIFCYNIEQSKKVIKLLPENLNISVIMVNPNLYF